jgi:gliding motility-associated-like protein
MKKMKFLYSLTLLALSFSLFSQRSKDGVGTISAANTIVNAYTSLTADANAGSTTINVANSASFSVGDLLLIVQMQGTKVNAFWEDGVFNDPNNSTSNPSPTNLVYGGILDYYTCGNNEFAEVTSIPNSTSITLDCSLNNSYTYSVNVNVPGSWGNHTAYGNVQVIRVPRYSSLAVIAGGSITCPQWNGTTGGVVAVETENNVVLSNSPSINVSGKGFRGGIKDNASSVFGGNKWGAVNRDQGGYKGESIAGDTTIYKNYAGLIGRGSLANGGGGGDAHNSGGGGGANGGVVASYNGNGNPSAGFNTQWNLEVAGFATNTSSGGGRGGYSWSNSNQSVTTKAPGNISWGGDNRRNFGGYGGRPLDYSSGRIYLGGGGGAGDGNENKAGAGGNGGGIVFLVCYGNLSGAGTIVADGANGSNTSAGCTSNDGAGGGGGGGTILLKVNGSISLTAGTALSAVGGNGGNVNFNCGTLPNVDSYGPGGSGGGGYIAATGAIPSNNVTGGTNGIQTGNGSNITANFPPNGATKGGAGGVGSLTSYTLTPSASQTLCTNQTFTVTASSTEPGTSISWYNTASGGTAIATGTVYSGTYASAGTYTLFAAVCPGTYRQPISITVTSGLSLSINSPTICLNQSVTLTATASGATTYTWNTGQTTSAISVSPASTTIYTVNATSGSCIGTQTTQVSVSSTPTISVADVTICAGNTTTLTANGANSYTWATGGQTTTSIVVSPSINTTYTITGANGICTNTTTATVSVTSTPTLVVYSSTICPGQTATLTASGAASFTWSPGNITGSTYTISPLSNTVVSVIGADGTCSSSATATITIGTGISVSVNNPTICAGQTASLTASGVTSYTWNTGQNTATLNVSPINTTTYNIIGMNGACSGSNTAVVTVVTSPSVSVANMSICSGNSATLTATGASNYTWAPNGQTTASIAENPIITTIYTITGSNGICTNTTSATVSVTSTPTLVVASSTICPGQTATLTASGANTFTWNPGNISGNTYTISPASNSIVSIDGANGTCTSSTTASITIGSGLSITVNSPTICAGETAILTANGAASYTWSTGQNTNTLSVSPTNTITYTVSGTNGTCTGSNTAVVSIAPTPALVVGTNSITLCSGQSTTLTASGATNYTWVPGNFSGSIAIVTPTINTTYTVLASNGTCTNSATSSVNLINCNSPCQFNLGNDLSFCSPINYLINGPTGYTSYSWSPSGAITQNLTATTGGTYVCNASLLSNDLVANGDFSLGNSLFSSNYIVPTVNGPFGLLSNPGTYAITTSPSLVHNNFLNFGDHTTGTGNMMVCNGASTANDIVWTETITVVPNTNYNFSAWVASTENTSAASAAQLQFSINNTLIGPVYTAPLTGGIWSNFFVNWNSGLNNTAVITILDQNTASGGNDFAIDDIFYQQVCTFSDTLVITDNPIPVVTASATNSVICNGNSTSLVASGANTYTWTSGVTNGANFTPTTTATYSVIGTSAAGCTNTAVTTITVYSTPTLSVNNPSICSGQTATLTVTGANTYTWSNTVIGSSQTVNPLTTTIYTVSGTDLNGCISTTVTTSTVSVSATPTITINSATICEGQSATLSAIGATNYTWSTTETTSSINTTPVITATYSVSGDNGGCSASASTTVSVTPLPTITASSNLTNGCAPFCTNFVDIVSPSATNIIYNFGDGTTSITNNPNHCYTTAGSYTVTAIATNSLLGCSSTFTLPIINVNITPIADFNITEGNTVSVGTDVHFTNSSLNADTYLWEILCIGETFISTNINKIISDTGICCIDLIAITNNGCSDTISKCITVISETSIVIPNVFTPNGDNKNDVFKIKSTGLKSLNCSIFNRWGLQIYEWEGINGYWDGTIKSSMAPDGTYYFIVNYTDQKGITKTEKGFLTLFQD